MYGKTKIPKSVNILVEFKTNKSAQMFNCIQKQIVQGF